MNALSAKLKETTLSVVPIAVVVLLLRLTLVSLPDMALPRFALGAVTVILGLSLFLLGVDMGIAPLGRVVVKQVVKSGHFTVIMGVTFVLGFLLTMAEPDILIYAAQVNNLTGEMVSSLLLMMVVSLGLAVVLCVGMVRILRVWWLKTVLVLAYGLVVALALVTPAEYLAVAFDASGATTEPLTVPVVLALAAGATAMKRDAHGGQNATFRLVAIACIGAIVALQLTAIVLPLGDLPTSVPAVRPDTTQVVEPLLAHLPHETQTVFLALIPLVALFLIGDVASFHLPCATRAWILSGIIMTFLGLTLFLAGANGGFMGTGRLVGSQLAKHGHPTVLLGVTFALGFLAVLTEPAIHMLTEQVQNVTSGPVRRTTVMSTMALDMGLAAMLSTLHLAVAGPELWHLLTAGYILALGLTFFSSELLGGLAFGGGGVAPGLMVTTFVLTFAQGGVTGSPGTNPVVDGLGPISTVALIPPIVIQLLGILFSVRARVRTDLRKPREAPHESDTPGKPDSQGNPDNRSNQNKPDPSIPEGK